MGDLLNRRERGGFRLRVERRSRELAQRAMTRSMAAKATTTLVTPMATIYSMAKSAMMFYGVGLVMTCSTVATAMTLLMVWKVMIA